MKAIDFIQQRSSQVLLHLGHSRRAVETNHGAVEHLILNNLSGELGKLIRAARPRGEDKGALEVLAHLGRHGAGHARLEEAGGNGVGADAVTAEVAGHGQGERGNGALAGRVRHLAVLAVKGGRGGDHDDDAVVGFGALALDLDDLLAGLAGEVNGAAEVDAEDKVKVVEAKGAAVAVNKLYWRCLLVD